MMTDNDIQIICNKIESLHAKILKSKFAEMVTESEILCLILAVQELNHQKEEIGFLKDEIRITRDYIHDNNLEWDLLSYCVKRKRGELNEQTNF